MTELDDHELLAAFACSESESAFAALVARHVNLVYSTALRFTNNPHHAQEITPAVFVVLARKAGSLPRAAVLSGWLYQTTRLTTANYVKGETRRQRREQEAYMLSAPNDSHPAAWQQIAPLLDDAMGDLGETDRNAVVLRFFENKTAQEVGAALELTEAAAHKRVSRAVEKLRAYFSKRGIVFPAAALSAAISANAVQAAPMGLGLTISTAAALAGTTLATTATVTVTATKAIAMTALQKTIVTATIAVLAGVGIYEARQASQLRGQVQLFQQQQAPMAEQVQQLQTERDAATKQLVAVQQDNERSNRNSAELLKLRARVVGLLQRNQELIDASAANSVAIDEADFVIPDAWANAGLETPTAAVRTYLWAAANTNIAKIKEVLLPPAREKEAFFEIMDKQGWSPSARNKGARILEGKQIGDDGNECLFMIERIDESPATTESGDPLNIKITSIRKEPVILRRINGVWRIAITGNRELSPEEIAKTHAEAVERENSDVQQ